MNVNYQAGPLAFGVMLRTGHRTFSMCVGQAVSLLCYSQNAVPVDMLLQWQDASRLFIFDWHTGVKPTQDILLVKAYSQLF